MMLLMLAMSHYDDDKSGISSQMQNLHLSYSKFFSKKKIWSNCNSSSNIWILWNDITTHTIPQKVHSTHLVLWEWLASSTFIMPGALLSQTQYTQDKTLKMTRIEPADDAFYTSSCSGSLLPCILVLLSITWSMPVLSAASSVGSVSSLQGSWLELWSSRLWCYTKQVGWYKNHSRYVVQLEKVLSFLVEKKRLTVNKSIGAVWFIHIWTPCHTTSTGVSTHAPLLAFGLLWLSGGAYGFMMVVLHQKSPGLLCRHAHKAKEMIRHMNKMMLKPKLPPLGPKWNQKASGRTPCHEQPSLEREGQRHPSCPKEHHKLVDVDGPVHILSVVSRDRVALDDSAALRPMIFLKNKRNSSQIEQMLSPKTCVGVYIYIHIYMRWIGKHMMFFSVCVYDMIIYFCIR